MRNRFDKFPRRSFFGIIDLNQLITRAAVVFCVLAFCLNGVPVYADPVAELPDGSKLDLGSICPICNMKLEASLLGPAAIVFKDGSVKGFDAAGDLFRFYLDPGKHNFNVNDVKNIYVTEFGSRKFIDAKIAMYVVGTDLQQGMGPEVAPFTDKEAAEKFKTQHNGTGIVEFSKVTQDHLKPKKAKLKMQHDH